MIARLARWSFRRRRIMVFAIWLPLLVGLSVASGAVGTNFHTSFTLPNSESKRVQDTLQSIGGGEQAGSVAQIVFTAPQGTADPAVQAAMSDMFTKVAALPGVKVTSPYSPEGQRFNSAGKPISFAQLSVTQRTQTENMALAKQIEAIGDTVTQIYESSAEIAAAITEQQSATDEIARNIQFISSSTDRISENMVAVRESADQTSVASSQVQDASGAMAGQTERMSVEVKDFLSAIKGSGTKHQFERLDADVQATIVVAGGSGKAVRARQLSIAGAWLDIRIDQPLGSSVEVTLGGVSRPIKARIAGQTDSGTRLQFPMDDQHLAFMTETLSALGCKVA